jgi:hypothetical protein
MFDLITEHPVISIFVGAIALILLLIILFWIMREYANRKRSTNMVFLRVMLPKKEGKEEKEAEGEQFGTSKDFIKNSGIMTQLLEALHAVISPKLIDKITGQKFFSFEYAVLNGQIYFYVVTHYSLQEIFEKQITAFYPDADIERVDDYNIFKPDSKHSATVMKFSKPNYYPFKTYQRQGDDPVNNILNAFSKLKEDEGAVIQVVLRPKGTGWQSKGRKRAEKIFRGEKKKSWYQYFNPITFIGTLVSILFQGPTAENLSENVDLAKGSTRTTPLTDETVKAMEEKNTKPGFDARIRVVTSAPTHHRALQLLDVVKTSTQVCNAPHLNSLTFTRYHFVPRLIRHFIYRSLHRTIYQLFSFNKMILCSEEVASIFHFPSAKYNNVPGVAWQRFKTARAPDDIPKPGKDTIHVGYNLYRGERREIHMMEKDRFRHLYIIGQTGTGKSVLLEQLAKQDIQSGRGCCIVDPHGDLVDSCLGWIPRERADDVIVFDPSDMERPMGLNMLEADTPEEKDFIALEAMNMMIGLFGDEIFGPRIQDYFRNGCLTLMDDPDGGALTDIVRLFTDDAWQQMKVAKVKNPIVKSFWVNQMAQTGQREKQEMIPYFAAKFGAFITNTLMRNIIGQTKSAFRFDEVMDSGKILLVKLSKGLIGDINANLLGMIFVNKIQVAAMRRQQKAKETRVPYYLYVDEFQNFITDSFESILSEARKYRLGLIIAHQYIDQLIKSNLGKGSDEKVKNAVFGNVGTMLNFKIGAKDAEYVAKEMAPIFSENDVINLEGFNTCIKLSIDNMISKPFSMKTVKYWEEAPHEKPDKELSEALVQLSRLKYGRDAEFVNREIIRRIGASTEGGPPPPTPIGL